jgi:uracil-DNA glycosylase
MPHPSWKVIIDQAYQALDPDYRRFLENDTGYFPPQQAYLNAFKTLPRTEVKYILFGQDPYPREESAGGYAFIDEKVKTLFCETGLSKEVNRATSLRNFIKMALVARGDLSVKDTSQDAIAALDKTAYIETISQLRTNFEKNGVLLLNTALVFTDKKSSNRHVKAWKPFMHTLLESLKVDAPGLILFGNHAKALKRTLPLENFPTIEMEHPYNHTFISNKNAHELFGPMNLLEK